MANNNTIYLAKRAAALTNPTSATVFVQSDNSANPAIVYIPGDSRLQGKIIKVRASGKAISGTTSNFKATIQYGTSATAGSNTDVAALTNRSYASTTGEWWIEAVFSWDSASQKLNGKFNGSNLNTADTDAVTTQVTSVDLSASGLGFVVSALFGSTNAANIATLSELSLGAE